MKSHFLPHAARALALVLLIASVAALAASNAAWAGSSQLGEQRQPGHSTVPRRGTDLEISQTYRNAGFNDVIFTITVTNTGPIAAQDVFVTDRISQRLDFAQATTSKGLCEGDSIIRCTFGNLIVGEVVTSTIRVDIWPDRSSAMIVNTAIVDSRTRDIKPSNNSASVRFPGRSDDFRRFDILKPGFYL
jgi:uncharacterized repeat protein (TIGR01451 family)